MATVLTLSSYSLATIALTVASASSTPTYIWQAAIPSGAKGKAGILQLFFNLYNATNFFANQTFNYGIYIDGVALAFGDSSTVAYTQTAASPYAISSGGVIRGTNGVSGYNPIILPVSFSSGASIIQLGITSSSLSMSSVTSANPVAASQTTYYTGNAGNNPFTSNYTVPSTASGSAVVGVYIYCWGGGGGKGSWNTGYYSSGAPGGFVSGYYACSPGTVLTCYSGGCGNAYYGSPGGCLAGVFLSNAAGPLQTNAIAIAGGGGSGISVSYEAAAGVTGGYGGYPNGGPSIRYNGSNSAGTCVGGSQTAGGTGGGSNGFALQGSPVVSNGVGGGGGGWYGGSGLNSGGSGGSSYIGNVNGATGGIGLTASAYWENGQAVTFDGGTGPNSNVYFPGGAGYTPAYGTGSNIAASNVFWNGIAGKSGITNGASPTQITVVPAIGSSATQVGVQASLFVL